MFQASSSESMGDPGSLMHYSSVSVDQATSSVETLTDLVHQVIQQNEDLRSRLGSLNCEPQDQGIGSAFSIQEDDKDDEASTIRRARPGVTATINTREVAMKNFAFEQELRQSRVYIRAMRRMSSESIQTSDAPSFDWSCLSEMSLAKVSNISVLSLPITPNELSNGEHYQPSWATNFLSPGVSPGPVIDPVRPILMYPFDLKRILVLG